MCNRYAVPKPSILQIQIGSPELRVGKLPPVLREGLFRLSKAQQALKGHSDQIADTAEGFPIALTGHKTLTGDLVVIQNPGLTVEIDRTAVCHAHRLNLRPLIALCW